MMRQGPRRVVSSFADYSAKHGAEASLPAPLVLRLDWHQGHLGIKISNALEIAEQAEV